MHKSEGRAPRERVVPARSPEKGALEMGCEPMKGDMVCSCLWHWCS